MKFPNKVTSYKESILSKFPIVLNLISKRDYALSTLYRELSDKISAKNFIDVLDCLYLLNKIELQNEVIHYVDRNSI